MTELLEAIKKNDLERVKVLISNGADINTKIDTVILL